MALAGELPADALARLVHTGALNDAVGASEIDVLENAEPALAAAKRQQAFDPFRADDDDLAGGDVTYEIGADDVERAGLRRQNPGIPEPAQHQRPHPQRVAHADNHVL